ncbi:hypothetical protein KDW18_37105, partial [Burkholderia cenocepacia]|nr:hypothetical protein [Burkholderia cenocepacia]
HTTFACRNLFEVTGDDLRALGAFDKFLIDPPRRSCRARPARRPAAMPARRASPAHKRTRTARGRTFDTTCDCAVSNGAARPAVPASIVGRTPPQPASPIAVIGQAVVDILCQSRRNPRHATRSACVFRPD